MLSSNYEISEYSITSKAKNQWNSVNKNQWKNQ